MPKQSASKGSWSRPLADLVAAAIDPVLARQGFGQSDLILFWDDIVGERLAAMSQPIKLQWPARDGYNAQGSATLVVRVETGFALELQHCSGAVIERVNAHLGWRCISRLALRQGPVERRAAGKPARSTPEPAAERKAASLVAGIIDDGLRGALARLGAHALSRHAPPSRAKTPPPSS